MNQVQATKMVPSLDSTDFSWLGDRYQGKVRDCYTQGDLRILIATDRLSAFDRILTTVPMKGQVLTQMAQFWFELATPILKHHVVAVPDPSVMVVKNVDIIPIEVVVRGYLAGSAARDYRAGKAISGVVLPAGLHEFDRLPEPIVTPSTKEAIGSHDTPISEEEIVTKGLVSSERWQQVRTYALQLFDMGSREVARRGLVLVDTKYEFGILNGEVVLADEIHTLDSSRFWEKESLDVRTSASTPPKMLDKEPIRRWLMDRGFMGDGAPPPIPEDYRVELTRHYVSSYERITGRTFVADTTPPNARIERNLREYFAR